VRSLWAPIYGTGAEQFVSWFGREFHGEARTVSTALEPGRAVVVPTVLMAQLVDFAPAEREIPGDYRRCIAAVVEVFHMTG